MRGMRFRFLLLMGGLILVLVPALAQITAGIRGSVLDPSGSAVPGASLTVTNEGTGLTQTTMTDVSGIYTFTLLPVGSYKLTVKAKGFATYDQTGIVLNTNQVVGLNVNLQVGATTQ